MLSFLSDRPYVYNEFGLYSLFMWWSIRDCTPKSPRPLLAGIPAAAPTPNAMAPAPNAMAPAQNAMAPAPNAMAEVPNAMAEAPNTMAEAAVPAAVAPQAAAAGPAGADAAGNVLPALRLPLDSAAGVAPEGQAALAPGNSDIEAVGAPGLDGSVSMLAPNGAPLADAGGPLPASEFQTGPVTTIAPEVLTPREAEVGVDCFAQITQSLYHSTRDILSSWLPAIYHHCPSAYHHYSIAGFLGLCLHRHCAVLQHKVRTLLSARLISGFLGLCFRRHCAVLRHIVSILLSVAAQLISGVLGLCSHPLAFCRFLKHIVRFMWLAASRISTWYTAW